MSLRRRAVQMACGVVVLTTVAAGVSAAGFRDWCRSRTPRGAGCGPDEDSIGQWYWVGSPEDQKRHTMSQFNHYCVRCHGVDGRGVWDIPDVPDFTNARWQASRTDGQLARNILAGRGAVMPAFRGTLTLEEAWHMARYLRTFQPGTEVSRPDVSGTPAPARP
jgi:hypothetical protein